MKYIVLLITSICYLFPGYSWEVSPAKNQVDSAIYNIYNYNFNSSLILLDRAALVDPGHPTIPFLETTTLWLKAQTESGYENSYIELNNSFNISLNKYQVLIEKNPNNAEYYLYLGSLYGLLTRIELGYGNWFKALFPTIKGVRYIDIAYSKDPNLYDTYTPKGLSLYYICLSNSFIRFISSFFGFDTDCQKSLEYLEIGSTKSYYSWIEADNALAYIYLYIERDYDLAETKIDKLIHSFPENPFFYFLKAEALCKKNKWEDYAMLRPILIKMANHDSKIIRDECVLKLRYLDAQQLFNNRDYYKVIELTSININNYNMEFDWLIGLSYYLRALAHIELGNNSSAIEDLKIVSSMNFFFPEIDESKDLITRLSRK